jgi:hypothetical protein
MYSNYTRKITLQYNSEKLLSDNCAAIASAVPSVSGAVVLHDVVLHRGAQPGGDGDVTQYIAM